MKKANDQKKQKYPKVIVIVGTTSSGKSDLAVQIAKKFDGEIISADSRQVYRGLDIGTGKITKIEMSSIPHHMLDVANPRRSFTAAQFKKKSEKILKDIIKRGKTPIIAGGTGFYIDTLLKGKQGFPFPEVPPNPKLRTQLEKKSAPELFTELEKLDPRRARGIDQHNPRRLIRAIEIAKAIGSVPEIPHLALGAPSEYDILWIGLGLDKDTLIEKMNRRNKKMFELGLVEEVKKLREQNISWKRIKELGFEYKFIAEFIRGKMSKEEALEKMNTETWHYAKRQKNWFNKNEEIRWFKAGEKKEAEKLVVEFIKKK